MKKSFSVILICCLGIAVYSNTFHSPFYFDDTRYIVENPAIKNIHDLPRIWNAYPTRFIILYSLALNYHFHQLNLPGYHLFNLTVHLICAILVWWLVLLTLSTPALKDDPVAGHKDLIALLAGLVFVSHPVGTEAVTYIWQRAASMAALFYLTSLCLYIKSRLQNNGSKRLYYALALMAATATMFTKENVITLPLMILLYEFTFLKDGKDFNWKYAAPFLLTPFIIPLTLLLTKYLDFREMHYSNEGSVGITSFQYLLTEFRALITYTRLLFLPVNQDLDYDYPIYKNIFELPVLSGLLFLILMLWGAWRLFPKYRPVSFSILWVLLALSVESSVIPLKDIIFEHRLYLPLAGYSLFLVSGLYYLCGKNNIKVPVIILLIIISCNSWLTYQRNKVWRDPLSLSDDTVKKSPHKARAYFTRGLTYFDQGNLTQAIADYSKAIEIDPLYAESYTNRGITYASQGNWRQAIADYDKAIASNPILPEAYCNRGSAYEAQGHYLQAMADYNRAIRLNPHIAQSYNNRGCIFFKSGRLTEAIADFNKAVEIDPGFVQAYINRGLDLEKQGRLPQALADYNKVIVLKPDDADAYDDRGFIEDEQGDLSGALFDYNRALALKPADAQAYANRGVSYAKQNDLIKAVSDFSKAMAIDPEYEESYRNRGLAYEKEGDLAGALSDFNKALELNTADAPAYNYRGNIYAEEKNYTQAIADYDKAIKIDPGLASTYNNRAILYYQLKKYGKAWADVRAMKALGASNPALVKALEQASGQNG